MLNTRSREDARFALSSCADAGLTVTANDNCFFGTPAVVDKVLAQFERRYAEVYGNMKRRQLPHDRPELQLTVAAWMAGAPLGNPCRSADVDARERARDLKRAARLLRRRHPVAAGQK